MTHCKIEERIDTHKLRSKGWSEREIAHTLKKLHNAEKHKSELTVLLDKSIYWTLLAVSVLGNFILSVTLVPVLLIFSGAYLALLLVFIALIFGYLFTEVIDEIDHFVPRQAIIAELFIPAIALINIYIITKSTNYLAPLLNLEGGIHNPLLISIIYVVSFSTPRVHKSLQERAKRKHSRKI